MIIRCKGCDEEFEDQEEFDDHVINDHTDVIDEKLMEYITEATEDAIEELQD